MDEDIAIFLLEDKRNGMYFQRFGYDEKTLVTDKLEDAKKFNTRSKASDYLLNHNLQDHYEVKALTV